MKTATFIEDGLLQIVLTPEGTHDRNVIHACMDYEISRVYCGEFYACRGGWVRESGGKESLIIVLKEAPNETDP